jgi:hypothetical protein
MFHIFISLFTFLKHSEHQARLAKVRPVEKEANKVFSRPIGVFILITNTFKDKNLKTVEIFNKFYLVYEIFYLVQLGYLFFLFDFLLELFWRLMSF